MKTLSPDQLLELLPVTDTEIFRAFELAAPILAREPGYVKELIDEGWLNVGQYNDREGRPSHVFGWHMTTDRGFWLDIVYKLAHPMPHGQFIEAVEAFARSQRCRYIRWLTTRRGIVAWAEEAGYTPEAVVLTKVFSDASSAGVTRPRHNSPGQSQEEEGQ